MTKIEFIERIHSTTNMTKKESSDIVEQVFSIMKAALEGGENLKISGFGNFEVKSKADRKGRNPISGDTITIAARKVLTFKPSLVLKQKINGTAE